MDSNARQKFCEWSKVDALALHVLELSLSKSDRDIFCTRIATDYFQDFGMMGLLRQTYVESGSIAEVGRLYWGSRREPKSPRLETIIGSLLMDLAANGLFEVLKGLAANPAHVRDFIASRAIDLAWLPFLGIDTHAAWRDLSALWQLHKWRLTGDPAKATTAIELVLEGGNLTVRVEAGTQLEVDRLYSNLEAIVRGLLIREVERDELIRLPANGRRYQAVPASHGLGRGKMEKWPGPSDSPARPFVLLIPAGADRPSDDLPLRIMKSAAIVTSGGMTGHAAVLARGMSRPAVLVNDRLLRDLEAYDELIVDGTKGLLQGEILPKDG